MGDDGEIDRARRKLLRAIAYTPPLILSAVAVRKAHAQQISCGPASCNPNGGPCGPTMCPPFGGPCPPNGSCGPRP